MEWLDLAPGLFLTLFGAVSAAHALLRKRDPRAALGWVAICLILPAFGPVLYWIFGVNRIHTRARGWVRQGRWSTEPDTSPFKSLPRPSLPPHLEKLAEPILNVSENVTRKPLIGGNRVTPLYNGEQAYPVMLDAIRSASSTVYLCTYIMDSDDTGLDFIDALTDATARGVDTRVLIDGMGELYALPRIYGLLKKQGVKAARFLPLSRGLHINLRNHRKLLVVDGAIGFTGGMNIGDRHLAANASNRRRVVDIQFEVRGPVVRDMEEAFLEDWQFATGQRDGSPISPRHDTVSGRAFCRAVTSGPNESFEKLHWIILGALSAARSRVRIMTPYFLPDRTLVAALNSAALRGVSVEIILPLKNNLPYIAWATQALLWEVLMYGVRVYFQPPPFVHTKFLLVDAVYALIGSSNLDPRSLRLNFEFNLEIFDARLTESLSEHFDGVAARSNEVTLEQINARSILVQLRDALAKLASPYL